MNIAIHGIEPEHVVSAPKFPDVYEQLRDRLAGNFVISHGWFDRGCMSQVLNKYKLPDFDKKWLDATRIVRRALPQFARRGYGLQNVAAYYGLTTNAHDALNDAQTCGTIVLNILRETETVLDDWLKLIQLPLTRHSSSPIAKEKLKANPEGAHYGESIVFTGILSLSRTLAQQIAANAGFEVQSGMSKKTDYLVCGFQELDKLAGHELSSKERKARDLVAKGHRIRLLNEADFLQICETPQ